MKVKMLVGTYHDGKRYTVGDTVNVDATTSKRWSAAGIAESLEEEASAMPPVNPLTGEPSAEKALDRMKTTELEEKANELGIDISKAGTNKERAAAIEKFIAENTEKE